MISVLDSELAAIGCALYDRDSCEEAFERLRGEHFAEPIHARLWEHLRSQDLMMDPVLLAQQFGSDKAFIEIGGIATLAEMVDRANIRSLQAHVDSIIDAATRRELDVLGKEVSGRARDEIGAGDAILADLERGASEIARGQSNRLTALPAGLDALEMVETAYAGGYVGAPVGVGAIDHVTGGVRQDDVWFIGGRTSMGKSVAGVCLARGIAEQGRGVLVFSLEMPRREVQARLIADIAYDRRIIENGVDGGNVRYGDILKGRGTQAQWERAKRAAKQLASLPISIIDKGGLTVDDIRVQAQRQFRAWDKAGVPRGALLIDHIGLVKPHRPNDSKAAETADTVNELKGMAKLLRAPVIALCQINRNTESRNDKRPTLADLNWSGAIEQISDFICLLYRDAYYLQRTAGDDAEMKAAAAKYDIELIVAKNRSGPICTLKAFADVACNAIRDLEPTSDRRFG